jgi:hypothetical protein
VLATTPLPRLMTVVCQLSGQLLRPPLKSAGEKGSVTWVVRAAGAA